MLAEDVLGSDRDIFLLSANVVLDASIVRFLTKISTISAVVKLSHSLLL